MSEMIERVARAILAEEYEGLSEGAREMAHGMAKRAIAAMREPTENMKRPLLRLMDAYASGLIPKDEDLMQAWRIAIAEALSNGE